MGKHMAQAKRPEWHHEGAGGSEISYPARFVRWHRDGERGELSQISGGLQPHSKWFVNHKCV